MQYEVVSTKTNVTEQTSDVPHNADPVPTLLWLIQEYAQSTHIIQYKQSANAIDKTVLACETWRFYCYYKTSVGVTESDDKP